ncbi:hypothetical protein M1145_02150 [Patescibacteria group bacterium]|nr:hypothetical protein [Patescibacteria group bacterium]
MINRKTIVRTFEKTLLVFLIIQIGFTFIHNSLSTIFIIQNLIYTLMGFAIIFILNYIYLKNHSKIIQSTRYFILLLVIILNILQVESNIFIILFIILAIDIILEQKEAKKVGTYLSSILIIYITSIYIYNPQLIYIMRYTSIITAITYFLIFIVSEYNNYYLSQIKKINIQISEQEELKKNERKFLKTTENIISNNVQMIQKISHSNNLLYDIHKNRIYILNMISMRLAQKGILNINLDIISLNEIINIIISEFKKYKRKLNIDFNIDETIKSYILMDRILFENIINVILIFAEENHIQTVHISLTSIPDFMQIQISFDNNISTYFKENNISEIQNKISWMQLLAIYATSLGGNYNMQPNGINLNFVKSLIQ